MVTHSEWDIIVDEDEEAVDYAAVEYVYPTE